MNSTLSINSLTFTPINSPQHSLHKPSIIPTLRSPHNNFNKFIVKSASIDPIPSNSPKSPVSPLKSAAAALIFAAAAFGKFPNLPAKAEVLAPSQTLTEELSEEDTQLSGEKIEETQLNEEKIDNSPLTQLLESSPEAIEALQKLLQEKLEAGEDEESLSILRKMLSAQPDNFEWKFLTARLLNEMGKLQEARDEFEEILSKKPLSFEALFENALLMDKSGESAAVMRRLEEALGIAENENKVKEARDVKLIMAQMQFLHKNVEEALRCYDELVREDPSDFRPYFCKGMIYSLMDKNEEAREQFAKYRELSPKKFEVEGYLRTPLSRMKLFGTDGEN